MTELYLAHSISGEAKKTYALWNWEEKPMPILVSFFYLKDWLRKRVMCKPAKTILDSGAYSAWNSGGKIDIDALTKESCNPIWGETIALDVIGDPGESLKNARLMRDKGSKAYPVFHIGEPWDYLKTYCDEWDKIGISCRFGESMKESMRWIEQCFARAWPHKFHSFGWVSEKLLMSFPFHSADTASWVRQPAVWGSWKTYGGKVNGLKGTTYAVVTEMEYYWDLAQQLKSRWRKEFEGWS